MENQELVTINYESLPAFTGAKEKQEQLIKDNPFISISDNKSYQLAKQSRTALRSGRTELQNGEKTIATKLKEFRDTVKSKTLSLINITVEAEEAQQAEITRYENQKQQEKEAEAKKEAERLDNLKNDLNLLITQKATSISVATIQTIDSVISDIESLDNDFQDIQTDFLLRKSELLSNARLKGTQLSEQEKLRLDKIEQEKERKRLENEKAEFEAKKKADEAKRLENEKIQEQANSAILAINLFNVIDDSIKGMINSSQQKEISVTLEKAIQGDFGIENDNVAKHYKIIKEKLVKKHADLLEKEEKEKAEQEKESKQRQELGKQRQEQLKAVNVSKSIDDCLLFTEMAYFEFFKKESEKYRILQEKEEKINRRKTELEPYLEFIDNLDNVLFLESSDYNSKLKSYQNLLKEKKEKFIKELEEKELEEKRQAELNKSDLVKANELIEDLKNISSKYEFKSEKYINAFCGVKEVLEECIEFISKK